jgi:hypothetical protein
VAMVDNYEPIPTTVEKEPNSFIISELGTAFRDTAGLELSESYRSPEININSPTDNNSEGVIINSNDNKVRVEPNTSTEIRHTSTQIKTKVKISKEEKIQNDDIPEHKRANKIASETREVSIEPVVKIKNYGEIAVTETTHRERNNR